MHVCEINCLSKTSALLEPLCATNIDLGPYHVIVPPPIRATGPNIVSDKYEYYHYSEFIKRLQITACVVFEVERT